MSALSEQCEVLRLWAKHLREGEPILASDLREAADTILNLRDMAQQAQSEKAALERRIDELCAEVERGKAEFKKMDVWHSQELKAAMDEKAALCTRIDELCQENERLRADQVHWELGNCPSCPNIADLQEALEQNAKLREQVDYMTPLALYAASERERDRMRELGIEVPS